MRVLLESLPVSLQGILQRHDAVGAWSEVVAVAAETVDVFQQVLYWPVLTSTSGMPCWRCSSLHQSVVLMLAASCELSNTAWLGAINCFSSSVRCLTSQ